ncbi:MAG TPA: holo-ACP synthase [Dongiaceae bacterium]|nr:holo-ACP synthase [Dongiaceae bacterium]
MIVGIGTDIIEVARMADSFARMGESFPRRLLTEAEFAEFQQRSDINKPSFLAKRFAAKEAAVKALGTGFADGITWKHVNIHNDAKGAPIMTLTGKALEYANTLGVTRVHLSLSDEKQHAVAFVVLEAGTVSVTPATTLNQD